MRPEITLTKAQELEEVISALEGANKDPRNKLTQGVNGEIVKERIAEAITEKTQWENLTKNPFLLSEVRNQAEAEALAGEEEADTHTPIKEKKKPLPTFLLERYQRMMRSAMHLFAVRLSRLLDRVKIRLDCWYLQYLLPELFWDS